MTDVIVDATLKAKLHNLDSVVRLCDESGIVLGYFHPVDGPVSPGGTSPIPDDEIERRRRDRTGRPLAEILSRLNRS